MTFLKLLFQPKRYELGNKRRMASSVAELNRVSNELMWMKVGRRASPLKKTCCVWIVFRGLTSPGELTGCITSKTQKFRTHLLYFTPTPPLYRQQGLSSIRILQVLYAQRQSSNSPLLDVSTGCHCYVVGLLPQNISTPIITAKLVQDDSKTSARVVKAKIEKTTLGQVRVRVCIAITTALGSRLCRG